MVTCPHCEYEIVRQYYTHCPRCGTRLPSKAGGGVEDAEVRHSVEEEIEATLDARRQVEEEVQALRATQRKASPAPPPFRIPPPLKLPHRIPAPPLTAMPAASSNGGLGCFGAGLIGLVGGLLVMVGIAIGAVMLRAGLLPMLVGESVAPTQTQVVAGRLPTATAPVRGAIVAALTPDQLRATLLNEIDIYDREVYRFYRPSDARSGDWRPFYLKMETWLPAHPVFWEFMQWHEQQLYSLLFRYNPMFMRSPEVLDKYLAQRR